MNEQTIKLDLSKRSAISSVLYIRQGDKNGTQLKVDVYKNDSAFTLTGYSVKFAMRSPHGQGYYECDGTVSGNRATFTIDETYAGAFAGITEVAYVEIIESGTVIASTQQFRVVVLESATENIDPNGAYTNGVQRFLDDAQDTLDDAVSDAGSRVGAMLNESEQEIEQAVGRVDDAVSDLSETTDRAEAAIAAIGDISELAVPLMSADTRGGAKLGNGLRVDDDALSVGNLVHSGSGAEVVTDGCAIFSVDGQGWAEQDGTPTPENPQEIKVARGRNLFDKTAATLKAAIDGNGAVIQNFGDDVFLTAFIKVSKGVPVYIPATNTARRAFYDSSKTFSEYLNNSSAQVYTPAQDGYLRVTANVNIAPIDSFQIELGTTPTPYVPYGHVGLEVTHNGTTTVTPVPLPLKSDGERWAGGLPDGTADSLAVDSAGRYEWTNDIARIASYNGESVGSVYMSTTGQLTTGAEVYYKSAQAGEHSYIDLPALPNGATVSIPELQQIGVGWFVPGAKELVEHAENWHKREDLESRVEALEAAIAELATA